MRMKIILWSIVLFFANFLQAQEVKEKEDEIPCETIDWDHYFVRYHKTDASNDTIETDIERTWFFLAPLTKIEPNPGEITITGYTQEWGHGISKKLYEDIYKCYGLKADGSHDIIELKSKVRFDDLGKISEKAGPGDKLRTVKVRMPKGKIFKYKKWGSIRRFKKSRYWSNAASILTIPVKARRASGPALRRTTSGLKNLGLNLDVQWWEWHRYYSNGKSNSFRLAYGAFFGPTVEDVKMDELINSTATKDTKQLFFSWGASISFAINDINLLFIPFGMDHATESIGKSWAFNERRWWGFGIGIETKALGAVLSKN